VSSRTCPDWPTLMEIAPQLQFKHCTLAEVGLPPEAFVRIEGISFDQVAICCDLDAHVFNPDHTDPQIVTALQGTHWIDVRELGRADPPAAA
jgi:hypothetical protein